MKQTILSLVLLLATPLIGLAAPSHEPGPLTGPTTPSDGPAPLAICAALPATGAPQVHSEQDSPMNAALVTCSSYCGHPQCLGQTAESTICILGPGKVGTCTPATDYCSTDHRIRCFCDWSPER
jgi:hypothetical protein